MNAAAASSQCSQAMDGVGAGIGLSLRAVDCAASQMAQAAFGRLFGVDGALGPALTIVLTLFIALLGFGLLTGRTRIGLASLTPRMATLALVVTFTTSWLAFQSVFWNLAVGAPDQIAGVVMGTQGSATTIFADKLDLVLLGLMNASGDGAGAANASLFSPPGLLWAGGTLLLLGTVGVLATCKIALAVLMALGPVFIAFALFKGTRGLFAGWLKGVAMLALAPLFAVLGGSLMLELAVPVLAQLSQTPGQIDVRVAMAFFMIGAVHCALMVMVLKTAATMVQGWNVFGFAPAGSRNEPAAQPAPASVQVHAGQPSRAPASAASPAPARDIRVASTTPVAANDAGRASVTTRETRIVGGGRETAAPANATTTATSRARGVGSRFKSAPVRSETLR